MKRRPTTTLAALALAALMAAATPSWAQVDLRDPFDVRMQEGTQAYALEDYEAAARHFGDARLLRPDSPEAAMNQGLAEARQGLYGEALETLDDAAALGRDLPEFAPLPRFNEGVANLRRAEGLLDPENPKPPKPEDRNQAIESLLGAIDAFGDVQAGGALGDAARVGRQLAQSRLVELTRPTPTPPPSDQPSDEDKQQQQQQQQDQQQPQNQNQNQQQDQQNQQQSADQQQQSDQRSTAQQKEQPDPKDGERSDEPPRDGPKPSPTPGPDTRAEGTPDFNKPKPTPTPAPKQPGDKGEPRDEGDEQNKPEEGEEGNGAQAQAGEAREGEGDGEGEPATPVSLSPQEAERLLNMIDDKMLMFRQGQQTTPRSGKDW